ncbi:MAG: hypothetical protein OXB88_00200 [Bacteriovoracales bacterium]|nr:hypothetical protein [Bacteriovoracales bacterium]
MSTTALILFAFLSYNFQVMATENDEKVGLHGSQCLQEALRNELVRGDICYEKAESTFERENKKFMKRYNAEFLGQRSFPTGIDGRRAIITFARFYKPQEDKSITIAYLFRIVSTARGFFWKRDCTLELIKTIASFPTNEEEDALDQLFCSE